MELEYNYGVKENNEVLGLEEIILVLSIYPGKNTPYFVIDGGTSEEGIIEYVGGAKDGYRVVNIDE